MLERGFYSSPNNDTFVLRSKTLCGNPKIIPEVNLSGLEFEDPKMKLIKFVSLVNELKNIPDKEYKVNCSWLGTMFQHSGYSTMNRNFVRELIKLDVGVKISRALDFHDCYFSEIENIVRGSIAHCKKDAPSIWGQVSSVPQLMNGKSRSIHFTMSEFSSNYNSYSLSSLLKDDEIWVPTQWDAERLASSGFNKPIFVIPLGVDSELYSPKFNKITYSSGANTFKFLSVMSWNWRKGFDVLFKAYFKRFTSKDDVSLILFTREGVEPNAQEELSKIISAVGSDCPHVVLCQSIIPTFAMPYIYCDSNAFVAFPRGEGWGLPLTEACSCEIPVISSFHGGQAAFLTKDDSFLVEPDMLVPASNRMHAWSKIYEGTYFVDYSDKVINEASDKMKYVYDNYSESKNIAKICRKRIVRDFDWSVSARKVYNRLVEIN